MRLRTLGLEVREQPALARTMHHLSRGGLLENSAVLLRWPPHPTSLYHRAAPL